MKLLRLEKAYAGVDKVRFVEHLERGAGVMAYYDHQADTVSIYPTNFMVGNRIDLATYAAFGERYWDRYVSNESRAIWARKLVYPDAAIIDRVIEAFRDVGNTSYEKVLEKFTTATDRLQAIHIINAFIKNNIPITQARFLNPKLHSATKEFCAGHRPYSLTPLLSAYSGSNDLRKYSMAFAQFCASNGKLHVSELSTAGELVNLFEIVSDLR
jgi:hypothetical protein